MAYVQFLGRARSGSTIEKTITTRGFDLWNYLTTVSKEFQLYFALDQSIAANYFCALYGIEGSEFVRQWMIDFAGWTKNNIDNYDFGNSAYNKVRDAVVAIQKSWGYCGTWQDVDIKHIKQFVCAFDRQVLEDKIPVALSVRAMIPYLIFRNKFVAPEFEVYPGEVTVPIFRFWFKQRWYGGAHNCIEIMERVVGNSFEKVDMAALQADPKTTKIAKDLYAPAGDFDILQFLAGCRFCENNFDWVIGFLAALCIHTDDSRAYNRNFKLFYATNVILNDLFSADFLHVADTAWAKDSFETISEGEADRFARSLLALLAYSNMVQGVKFKSMELFNRFFSRVVKNTKTDISLVFDYVKEHGENVASAEAYAAFKDSVLAGTEAISLISQQRSNAQEDRIDENTDGADAPDEDDDLNVDLPEMTEPDPALEADDTADDDTTTDGDGTDKGDAGSGEEGDGNADDPDKSQSTSGEENGGDGDDNTGSSSGEEAGTDPATDTQQVKDVENVETSDDEGIVFKVNAEGNETVDSVLFREELEKFLTDVLTNPPKTLSPQSVSTLTNLQIYWVHLLSVETIMGILKRVITVPEKFNNLLYSEKQKHE